LVRVDREAGALRKDHLEPTEHQRHIVELVEIGQRHGLSLDED